MLSIRWKNKSFSKYIVDKGSICVNGISLTIAKSENHGEIFTIAIIPHTWSNTNLKYLTIGDSVNLEGDALIKYVEKLLFFDTFNFYKALLVKNIGIAGIISFIFHSFRI